MKAYATLTLAALATTVLAVPAAAQNLCSQRTSFIEHLGNEYHETTSAAGVASDGSVVEVLTAENGSWSILITKPNGVTCLVASGDSWEDLEIVDIEPAA